MSAGRIALVNGVALDHSVEGPAEGPLVLLVMGLAMQRVAWPAELLSRLHAAGLRTLTFDNRDVGLSTRYDDRGVPGFGRIAARRVFGADATRGLPYTLSDLADDAAALLDHVGVAAAHVVGISMGGMIAQRLAIQHPHKVASLTLLASSSGRLGLPLPRAKVMRVVASRPRGPVVTREAAADYQVRLFTALAGPGWPMPRDELARRAREHAERASAGSGVLRQFAAIMADGERWRLLDRIAAPTQVLHGDADPMLPLAHGIDLARRIPRAEFDAIAGWGHDLPDALLPEFAERIVTLAGRSIRP
jgi:pimeloyl-ACP methyl ester carboxylesterase